jgi:hypothetical protein
MQSRTMPDRNRDRRGMDRVSEDTTADTGPWAPSYDIGLGKHLTGDSQQPMSAGEMMTGAEVIAGHRLMVRVDGKLLPVLDYSIMPRREMLVLETEL